MINYSKRLIDYEDIIDEVIVEAVGCQYSRA